MAREYRRHPTTIVPLTVPPFFTVPPRLRALAPAIFVLAAFAMGCRIPVGGSRKPGVAPRCENGLCVEVVAYRSGQPTMRVWIDAPPATRLVNARVTADAGPPCQGQFPLEWVAVDRQVLRVGPADVSGRHDLVLEFPLETWMSHSGYWRAMFLDLELDVAGTPRCLRTRLTNDDGKDALGL